VLHERNVVLTVEYAETPRVPEQERVEIEPMDDGFVRVRLRFGFMEVPNIPGALTVARKAGWQFEIMSTSFYVSRRSLRMAARSEMTRWQERLFITLASGASDATDYFQIPTGRVVEIGAQVAI
jgi:KUP system potassium uptake protein